MRQRFESNWLRYIQSGWLPVNCLNTLISRGNHITNSVAGFYSPIMKGGDMEHIKKFACVILQFE